MIAFGGHYPRRSAAGGRSRKRQDDRQGRRSSVHHARKRAHAAEGDFRQDGNKPGRRSLSPSFRLCRSRARDPARIGLRLAKGWAEGSGDGLLKAAIGIFLRYPQTGVVTPINKRSFDL